MAIGARDTVSDVRLKVDEAIAEAESAIIVKHKLTIDLDDLRASMDQVPAVLKGGKGGGGDVGEGRGTKREGGPPLSISRHGMARRLLYVEDAMFNRSLCFLGRGQYCMSLHHHSRMQVCSTTMQVSSLVTGTMPFVMHLISHPGSSCFQLQGHILTNLLALSPAS